MTEPKQAVHCTLEEKEILAGLETDGKLKPEQEISLALTFISHRGVETYALSSMKQSIFTIDIICILCPICIQ
jgi:hypothetical protein